MSRFWRSARNVMPLFLLAVAAAGALAPGKAESATESAGTITVGTAQELRSALKDARAGWVINLRPGDYGRISISGFEADSYVTLQAADREHPPVLPYTTINKSAFLRFKNIVFARDVQPEGRPHAPIVALNNSHDVIFEDSEFHGSVDGDYNNDPVGLTVRNAHDIAVVNNRFHDLGRGAKFRSSQDLLVAGNRIENLRSDGIDFAEVNTVRIEGNQFSTFYPNWAGGDHPDYVQFWTRGTKKETTDVAIVENVFLQGRGTRVQCIFIGNEKKNWFYRNFRIERNVIYQSHFHAISAYRLAGATIARNTIVAFPGASQTPGINLFGTSNVTVSHNVVPVIRQKNDQDTRLEANVLAADSYIRSSRRPANLFVDPEAGPGATRESFYPKPGGPLDRGEAIGALQRNGPS